MMELVDLFPRTIAVAELQSLTPEIIARAIEQIDIASGNDVPGDGAYTSDQQFLNRAIFREVKQEIIGMCRSEEHTSELQSLMRISYAVFCLKKKNTNKK